jgi:hypothetical protein
MAVVENIVGGENYNAYKRSAFHSLGVRNEFNADIGATYAAETKSGFSKGYKYVIIIAIHKVNVADAYTIFLCDNYNDIINEFLEAFHSMKFMPDDLNATSILFTAASIISSIKNSSITVDDIVKKIGYNPSQNLSKDDCLYKIAKAYSLKLNKMDIENPLNFCDYFDKGNVIIVIYNDKKVNHSAIIFGYKKIEKNKLIFMVKDSTISHKDDSIDASTLLSDHWQTKVDRAYYFSK